MELVECVPNFSEGRRRDVVDAIAASIEREPGASVLDVHVDADHNRSVVTFVAPPEAAGGAAFRGIVEAAARIDVTRHAGVHPRMGACDVCPLVPLGDVPMERCAELARDLGRRVAGELGIPVYLYGAAALRPERGLLPSVRIPLDRLALSIGADPLRAPDLGPPRLHPTAGAVAIGARELLIAFNVVLETEDVTVAREIAATIRERDGGLPGVRALGLSVAGARAVQVSTNVCTWAACAPERVFAEVERLAAARGVAVRESELVGLAPRAAFPPEVARRVRLAGFDPRRHHLEERIRSCTTSPSS